MCRTRSAYRVSEQGNLQVSRNRVGPKLTLSVGSADEIISVDVAKCFEVSGFVLWWH